MKLMILDGNSVINRAFYGVRLLSTKEGMFTNAIYGFLNILQHMREEERPDALCVAFDLHGPTFRHQQYAPYKATRHGMPDELAMQMPVMKDVLRAMNIPIYECQGWEADDVIGTVAKNCSTEGWDCVIVTGDRDQLQLIDDHVTVKLVVTRSGQTASTNYTPEVFRQEYGFEPIHLIDLKGLMGDSSDNLPGVAGVGPKTATDLLLKYGTLSGVYENLDSGEIKGKLLEKLRAGREDAFLTYSLATIVCEAPIQFAPSDALCKEPDQQALYDLFCKLEFVKLIDRYHLRPQAAPVKPAEEMKQTDVFPENVPFAVFFDANFETVAFASAAGVCTAAVCSCEEKIRSLLANTQPKYCFDLKNLYHLLSAHAMQINNVSFDAQIAAYVLDPTASDYAPEKLSLAYLGEELAEKTPVQIATAIFRLQEILPAKMEQEGLTKLYSEIELPLCKTLFRMEQAGIAVDRKALENFGIMLRERIAADEERIYAYAGGEFNINSTKQLGQILFEKLSLPPVKKTKSGYSTNAEVLEKLRNQHPIVEAIMDYRMLTKLNSTYADGLIAAICPDGRIRTTFQNTVTATGRLSSTEPNLQNIPVRTTLGAEIRKMFVPQPGWVLVDADYSQIELRVLAHIADDKIMQQAFTSGEDFHKVTASQVFGVPLQEVTAQMRRSAKAVNFGIVYGISAHSLSEDIGTTNKEAQSYIDSYLARFTGVKKYMTQIVQTARDTGAVSTLFGRTRKIPEIKSANFNIRMGAERIALNTPVQGTAADIIKLAMINVDRALEENALQARLVLQVHDELIVECPAWEAELVMRIVTEQMEQVCKLSVPLVAEAKMGNSWYETK